MNHVRHSNIFTVPPHFSVHIVGAGGLGAITALVLAKMGVRLMTVCDPDVVSEENIATQLHSPSEMGNPKIESLANTLAYFSDEILYEGRQCRVTDQHVYHSTNLVIAAVDSIEARQNIWTGVTISMNVDFFLDMRMAAEELQMFLIEMHDLGAVERYHELLVRLTDADIPNVSCTRKATFFTAATAAGHAGKVLRDIVRGEAVSHRLVHYIAPEDLFRQQVRIFAI